MVDLFVLHPVEAQVFQDHDPIAFIMRVPIALFMVFQVYVIVLLFVLSRADSQQRNVLPHFFCSELWYAIKQTS